MSDITSVSVSAPEREEFGIHVKEVVDIGTGGGGGGARQGLATRHAA